MTCTACGAESELPQEVCAICGARQAPQGVAELGDATGGIIPYKNPAALVAYYLGIFSILPCIGIPMGLTAVVLGIIGLRKRKQTPQVKGSVHAWIGIVAGGIMAIVWVIAIVLVSGGYLRR